MLPLASGRCFRIEIDDGVVVSTLWGEGDTPDVEEYVAALVPILQLRAPACILTDATDIEDLTMRARWVYAQKMTEHRRFLARSAVVGLSPRMDVVLRVLVRASGRSDLRVFYSRQDAMAWLRDGLALRRA